MGDKAADLDEDAARQTTNGPISNLCPDVKRPDKVYPYRLNFWAGIMCEDNTSEIMNVVGMLLSMIGILLKYKTCAWSGVLVAAVSYTNARTNHDSKQIISTFLLSMSSVVMCYLINMAPISQSIGQQRLAAPAPAPTVTTAQQQA